MYIISSVECVFENLFKNQNDSSIKNRKKKVIPTGTKGPTHVVRPGGLFSPGWYYQPGLKWIFSPERETGIKGGALWSRIRASASKTGTEVY